MCGGTGGCGGCGGCSETKAVNTLDLADEIQGNEFLVIFQAGKAVKLPISSLSTGLAIVGAKILFGAGVPSGATGSNGDVYIDTVNFDVYQKDDTGSWINKGNLKGADGADGTNGTDGADGANGADGTNGTNGTNGATWSNGTTVPDNANGANGDYYLHTTTGDVYKKIGGVWTVVANIKGADGADGVDGTNGTTIGINTGDIILKLEGNITVGVWEALSAASTPPEPTVPPTGYKWAMKIS